MKKILIIFYCLFIFVPNVFAFQSFDSFDFYENKNRDFSIIDERKGEKYYHELVFKNIWLDQTYSVRILRIDYGPGAQPTDPGYIVTTAEGKLAKCSDVDEFMAVIGTSFYNVFNVKFKGSSVRFECKSFVNKLTLDTEHMLEIK